jgi:hydroxymethylpyrimidine/phosphomethylpyrimidine kinase
MVAKGGASLMSQTAEQTLIELLLPLAGLVTPNLPEMAVLVGQTEAQSQQQMQQQAEQLIKLGAKAVLAKGGHLVGHEGGHEGGQQSNDLLITQQGFRWFNAPRIATANTHGTGCTLGSAICSYWAQNADLPSAVAQAKTYIQGAIQHANQLKVGQGHGPTHHFYSAQ